MNSGQDVTVIDIQAMREWTGKLISDVHHLALPFQQQPLEAWRVADEPHPTFSFDWQQRQLRVQMARCLQIRCRPVAADQASCQFLCL
jgi:hypothetical protein